MNVCLLAVRLRKFMTRLEILSRGFVFGGGRLFWSVVGGMGGGDEWGEKPEVFTLGLFTVGFLTGLMGFFGGERGFGLLHGVGIGRSGMGLGGV